MDNIINTLKKNRKIVLLVVAILLLLIVFKTAINGAEKKNAKKTDTEISDVIKKKETKVIFIGSSNSKKCKKCKEIKNYLDKEGIKYINYDVENHTESEYQKMLQSIEINPDDFGYPGVVYIRDGRLYSNVININDIKSVETFIKDYELKSTNK